MMVSVCLPLMPSHNTYHLTWFSLPWDMGYLFMAAPAKRSHSSLPWMRGISSLPPLLTLSVEWLLSAASPDLGIGVTDHWDMPIRKIKFLTIRYVIVLAALHCGSLPQI